MKNSGISVIIVAKNEEAKIKECLESVSWADEIILIDTGSIDRTMDIAGKFNANIYELNEGSWDLWRSYAIKKARFEWILYVDADERVTPLLRKEIETKIKKNNQSFSAFAIPRRNIILGKEMKHGGWWPDYVKRLYKREAITGWKGSLHEEPVFKGEMGHLINPLTHIKHANLTEMVEKTNKWSETEAKLLYDANHPPMKWWRFARIMLTEIWLRLIKSKGYKDGAEGIIYSFYQVWSRFLTYAKLWEMQLKN